VCWGVATFAFDAQIGAISKSRELLNYICTLPLETDFERFCLGMHGSSCDSCIEVSIFLASDERERTELRKETLTDCVYGQSSCDLCIRSLFSLHKKRALVTYVRGNRGRVNKFM
jgi:hypothetical protein